MDPEELFRKIFGSGGLGGFGNFSQRDYEESMDGFAPASEVHHLHYCSRFVLTISIHFCASDVN